MRTPTNILREKGANVGAQKGTPEKKNFGNNLPKKKATPSSPGKQRGVEIRKERWSNCEKAESISKRVKQGDQYWQRRQKRKYGGEVEKSEVGVEGD